MFTSYGMLFCFLWGRTALCAATLDGYTNVVEILIKMNANVNLCDGSKTSALLMACDGGHLEIAKILIENNANLNLKNEHGLTPLYNACQNGHIEVMILFLIPEISK